MLEGIIISLVVAIISVLAFVAYRHPLGYQKVYSWLVGLSIGIFVILVVWNGAISAALIKISFDPKFKEARDAVEQLQLPALPLVLINICTLIYLNILMALPSLGIVAKENGSDDKTLN